MMPHALAALRRPALASLLACGAALSLGAPPAAAQEPSTAQELATATTADVSAETPGAAAPSEIVGTIVVAHGGSAAWNAPVLAVAEAAEASGRTGGPVEVALLMGDSVPGYRFQDAAARLAEQGATRIVVVPLLASSHSSHYEQIRWLAGGRDELSEKLMHHLHEGGITRAEVDLPMTLTPALDASMEIATILAGRALALAEDPGSQALFVVGHGPSSAEDYAEWMRNLRPVTDSIAKITGFRDVKLGLVRDDAPDEVRAEAVRRIREIVALQHELTGRDVVIVPILVSKGYISTRKLPKDLDGLAIAYDGEGLLPHATVADWIVRRVTEASRTAEAAPETTARTAASSGG